MPQPLYNLLSLQDLSCGYGDKALFTGLYARCDAGELIRVLGPNGTGKSTLLKTLAGLQRPLQGSIHYRCLADQESVGPDDPRHDACFVGHHNALNGALTPLENLEFLMQLAGQPCSRRHIIETLKDLGLKSVMNQSCRALSAGQQRRVSLARLWLTRARLWLLDEPASALDVTSREWLAGCMSRHATQGGLVIFTTHELLPLHTPVRELTLSTC